jgi:hypothetical protein
VRHELCDVAGDLIFSLVFEIVHDTRSQSALAVQKHIEELSSQVSEL